MTHNITGEFLDSLGEYPHLKGKTALLRRDRLSAYVRAQFDDITLKEGHGWYTFPEIQFRIDDPNEPDETDEKS